MTAAGRIRLLTFAEHDADGEPRVLRLANDEDPLALKEEIDGVARIELEFPDFTDGRAYSQAYLLRRRLGFTGDLRATGDVLVDQLIQMERTGFSSAVMKDGVDAVEARRYLDLFPAFYQRDLVRWG